MVLTQNAFEAMLNWLDSDRDRARKKYEAIRVRLTKIFVCRGCAEAEDLSDQTINRVAARVEEISDSFQGDPALYFYGVASQVHREYLRSRSVQQSVDVAADKQLLVEAVTEDIDPEYQCLERCLHHLPWENRNLVLQYYQQDRQAKIEHRQRLATELGIAVNALRIRAHRIRRALQECVQQCLNEHML